jgi:hypothetical protein
MDFLIGVLAIIVGVSLALAGLRYFYLLLPIWGFVAGFFVGAALITAVLGDGFLATTLGIVVGLVFGVLFAAISYFYWYFTVVLAAATAGGVLGASIFGAIGVSSSWLLFFIGLAFAVGAAILALMLNLPVYLVVVNTALAGAAIAIGGVLMVLNKFDRDDIGTGALWQRIDDHWYLWVIWIVVAVFGMMSQLTARAMVQLPDDRWKPANAPTV